MKLANALEQVEFRPTGFDEEQGQNYVVVRKNPSKFKDPYDAFNPNQMKKPSLSGDAKNMLFNNFFMRNQAQASQANQQYPKFITKRQRDSMILRNSGKE